MATMQMPARRSLPRRVARFFGQALLILGLAILINFIQSPKEWIAELRAGWNSICVAP